MKMGKSDQNRLEDEIERVRKALDVETRACLELQRRLDGAYAEFEEFVCLTAHNLRESLRDVASFSQLIAETYAGGLDPEAGVFLGRIRQGAARMQSLLADVVDYWASSTAARQPSRTDMEAVLRQALICADKLITERSAIVTHDPLPAAMGDFEILTKVLHHLIRNALEYCGTPSPCVHISSGRLDPDWAFSVQDNGPGIEPAFQSRCKITVLVLNRHSKAAYSGCLSACTAKNTPGTVLDSPSARRPSSGMAGECGGDC